MATIVGIEPDYDLVTSYCKAFRIRFVYSHPTLTHNPPTHVLIACFDNDAVPAQVHTAMQLPDVGYVTGSGHGVYDRFTGQGGVTLWDAASVSLQQVAGKIIHLLSCQAGGILGWLFVENGARAFWGYTVNFTFFHQNPPPARLDQDPIAEIFFRMDAIIDRGILAGKAPADVYAGIASYFRQVYAQLLIQAPSVADALLEDFVHLACPVITWGDPAATI